MSELFLTVLRLSIHAGSDHTQQEGGVVVDILSLQNRLGSQLIDCHPEKLATRDPFPCGPRGRAMLCIAGVRILHRETVQNDNREVVH